MPVYFANRKSGRSRERRLEYIYIERGSEYIYIYIERESTFPVSGDVSCFESHCSIAERSYACPSLAITGSSISSPAIFTHVDDLTLPALVA